MTKLTPMRTAALLAIVLFSVPAVAQPTYGLRLGAAATSPVGAGFLDQDLWVPDVAVGLSYPVARRVSAGAELGYTRAGYATARVVALDDERDGLSTSVLVRERVRADYFTLAAPLTLRLGDARRAGAFVPVLTVAPRLDFRVRERAEVDVAELDGGAVIIGPDPEPTSDYTAVYDRYAYGVASGIGFERRTRAGALRLEARYARLRVGDGEIVLSSGIASRANQNFDQSHLGLRLGLAF